MRRPSLRSAARREAQDADAPGCQTPEQPRECPLFVRWRNEAGYCFGAGSAAGAAIGAAAAGFATVFFFLTVFFIASRRAAGS